MAKYDYSEYKDTTGDYHFLNATDPNKITEETPGYRYAPTARVEISRPQFGSNVHDAVEPQRGSLIREKAQARETPAGQQMKLFDYTRPWISGLYTDPSMRTAVPTLLGHALNKYPDVLADESLSQHSSRIVKKGIALGAVQGDPGNPAGDATFEGQSKDLEDTIRVTDENLPEGNVRMSDFDVAAARTKVRDVLRPKKLSGQFDTVQGPTEPHPQLPGMD